MIAIFSLLLVIALSLLIVRIGTVALTMTDLTEEVARFQALSAVSKWRNASVGPERRWKS